MTTMPPPPRTAPPPRRQAPPPPVSALSAPTATPAVIGQLSAAKEPPRIILNAVEGFGKTSCGAFAPDPVILMAEGETGAQTLLAAGLIPQIPGAVIETRDQLFATIAELTANGGYGTLVMDALSGFEKMIHTYICDRDFNGDWGEKGFASYQKGFDVSVNEWLLLLQRLDQLRASQNMTIIILSHTQVRPFKNPVGEDFDRYIADCHPKTWAPTAKWADAVLFGNFVTVVDKGKSGKERAKGIGGTSRVIYTQRRDAWDAKNRYGMPESIDLTDNPADNWNLIDAAINGTRKEVK